jgi:hypothetical protein
MGPSTFSRGFGHWFIPVVAAALVSLSLGSAAQAERAQEGNLIVRLDGRLNPRALPRQRPAPVAIHLAGGVSTADSGPLPRVNWIRLELAWRGVLNTTGLQVCPWGRLRGTTTEQALLTCGGSRVGKGRLLARIFVPNQPPFSIRARLIAFNGRSESGGPVVLVHAYAGSPPVSFTIPFRVHRKRGSFRTVLVALIRRNAGPWPHVANFQIEISRRFNYEGKQTSYLRASCPVPAHFTEGFLSFARATYSFEGGKQISTESVRSCRARH